MSAFCCTEDLGKGGGTSSKAHGRLEGQAQVSPPSEGRHPRGTLVVRGREATSGPKEALHTRDTEEPQHHSHGGGRTITCQTWSLSFRGKPNWYVTQFYMAEYFAGYMTFRLLVSPRIFRKAARKGRTPG